MYVRAVKCICFQLLTIFIKISILGVKQGFEYASALSFWESAVKMKFGHVGFLIKHN